VIEAALKDEAFLDDVRAAERRENLLHIWWLGQSGFLAAWNGTHVLFDPYLSDSLTEKYAQTDKPHVRMTEQVIAPERLDFLDVITSSHNHTDHLDAATLKPLMQANPEAQLLIPEANRAFVSERLGCPEDSPFGLDAGQSVVVKGVTFHGVPAAHESVEKDGQGRCVFMGYVAELGPFRIFHSGDTLLFEGLKEMLIPFSVDAALLPINGRKPERRVEGNLNGEEAARLAQEIGARTVIPCHYDMFEFNTETPGLFEQTCEAIGQPYSTLRSGERLALNARP